MKKGSIFITLGLLLLAAAFCLTSYNIWDNRRAGHETDRVLKEIKPIFKKNRENLLQAEEKVIDEPLIPDFILNPKMEMPTIELDGNVYAGLLTIPIIGIELPVFDEWSYENLKTAPCRYMGTAYNNNLVLCAHNYDVHFGNIKNLRPGDEVIFTDTEGNEFHYTVLEILTLAPEMIDEMISGDWDLTLFTCTIGGATRVTVRCEKTE